MSIDVIPMKPEVPFSTTTVENLKWFGHELTNQTIKKEYSFILQ